MVALLQYTILAENLECCYMIVAMMLMVDFNICRWQQIKSVFLIKQSFSVRYIIHVCFCSFTELRKTLDPEKVFHSMS